MNGSISSQNLSKHFTFEQREQLKSWGSEKCDVRGVDLQPEAPDSVLGNGLKLLPQLSSRWPKHFLLSLDQVISCGTRGKHGLGMDFSWP